MKEILYLITVDLNFTIWLGGSPMTDIVRIVNSDFDKEMTELVNDLYLAYDEESEKRLREDIKKMYNLRIPNIGYILDAVESDNYDTFHGITYTLQKRWNPMFR